VLSLGGTLGRFVPHEQQRHRSGTLVGAGSGDVHNYVAKQRAIVLVRELVQR
jgi:hypothetical protein